MKAPKPQPIGTMLLVLLCLILHTYLFAQSISREYGTKPENQVIASKSLLERQSDLLTGKSFYPYAASTVDPYVHQEQQKIRDAIGKSQWWDGLPREAQYEIRQKMQALPNAPSLENLQEILSISWKGQAIKRNPDFIQSMVTCPQGDVFLTSQDDVDAFGALGCTQVKGHLYIDDSGSAQKITDLTPLYNLQTVDGVFLITAPKLTTLEGLSNLSTVGYLRILSNDALTSLEGLSGITAFTGPITGCGCSYLITNNFIAFNPLIKDLSGLDNLTTVNSGFYISANKSLKNLNGLQQYTYSAAGLDIANHPALTSLHGLSGLETVEGNLVIRLNPGLKNLVGLSNLSVIGNTLIIDRNAKLKNLAGLSSLTYIGGALFVEGNKDLHNFAGLSSLSSVGNILVFGNPALKNLAGLNGISSVDGDLVIGDNVSLENVDALSQVTSVGGWMVLQELPSLENIDGLSSLSWAGAAMGLAACPLVENVDALSSLTQVDGLLGVILMDGLQNLDGLSNVTSVGGDLWVFLNPSLTSCCGIYQLLCADAPTCSSDAVGGLIDIFGNGSGCTPGDIIATCQPLGLGVLLNSLNGADTYKGFADLSVYPNPASTEMVIALESFGPGAARVEIINALGKTIWQHWIDDVGEENYLTVNLAAFSSLRAGIYFVSVLHGDKVYTKQLILER